ncbi:DUF2509 family protein [Tatumella sp. TA1]|nr:DUF2509 family protein [Tatumella sp. TA1]
MKPQLPPYVLMQQGNVTLLAVLVVTLLASTLLRATSHSLRYGAQQVNDEKQYLQAFYQAQSALAWGLPYPWPAAQGWHCPVSSSPTFSLCLWRETETEGWLRGRSQKSEWLLWQRVTFSKDVPHAARRHPRGWIDECPLSPEQCYRQLPRNESR